MRIALPLLLLVLLVGALAYLARDIKPPSTLRFATGIDGGGYSQIGYLYRSELLHDDIEVDLIETAGSIENVERLLAGQVDVAIVQGGIELPKDSALESLGAVFLEPIAIFHHASKPLPSNPGEWRNIRLAAGGEGSGTRAAAKALIKAADLQDADITLVDAGGQEALDALRAEQADAIMYVSPLNTPYLIEAIFDPEVTFMAMSPADAVAFRVPGARSVDVPAGAISLTPPRPPEELKVLALRASIIARSDLHPALADRIVNAAILLHGDRDFLHASREYPSVESPPIAMNASARQHILSGPNILHEFLPYWIAAQFGRVVLVVLPLLFIIPPTLAAIPSIYAWIQKRRIWSYYRRIAALEFDLSQAKSAKDISAVQKNLEQMDSSIAKLQVPLAYRQAAYDARLHIRLIRQETERRLNSAED